MWSDYEGLAQTDASRPIFSHAACAHKPACSLGPMNYAFFPFRIRWRRVHGLRPGLMSAQGLLGPGGCCQMPRGADIILLRSKGRLKTRCFPPGYSGRVTTGMPPACCVTVESTRWTAGRRCESARDDRRGVRFLVSPWRACSGRTASQQGRPVARPGRGATGQPFAEAGYWCATTNLPETRPAWRVVPT